MLVLTKTLIKESEENAVESGVFSFRQMMLSAGLTASDEIRKITDVRNKKIAVLCGNGNNGGDGCVIANTLYEYGAEVTVITPCGAPVTENAAYYYGELPSLINKTDKLEGVFDIIIDAVFGIGLNRAVPPELCRLFEAVNATTSLKIAIDIPSGIETDTGKILGSAICADHTITFIALKPCFLLPDGSDYCGKVTVANIGVAPEGFAYQIIEKPIFPPRRHNSHKGTFGTALLICGSYGMAGAAILAAKAALRSGVGIAKCVLCEGIYSAFTAAVPEAVCVPVKQNSTGAYEGDAINIPTLAENCKAMLFGCGVGDSDETAEILEQIIENSQIPVVIDADGINALSRRIDLLKKSKAPIIITPHPGEMARLCKKSVKEIESNRVSLAREFAQSYGCTVVLKGANTVVAEKNGSVSFNITGNPGMATGGSGDVLAGITVSLLAQGFSPEAAAKAAVYLHGEAGDKAALRKGQRAMLPSDIIEEL